MMKTKNFTNRRIRLGFAKCKTQKGFTLLEVMVAVILLGLAFLSMTMLQINSLRYSSTAYYRGIASQVGNGLASSIRANPKGLQYYSFNDDYDPASTIPTGGCQGNTICSTQNIAKTDIAWARQSARNQLPGGDLKLKATTGAGKDYVDLILVWVPAEGRENEESSFSCDAGVADSYGTAQCMSIRVKI